MSGCLGGWVTGRTIELQQSLSAPWRSIGGAHLTHPQPSAQSVSPSALVTGYSTGRCSAHRREGTRRLTHSRSDHRPSGVQYHRRIPDDACFGYDTGVPLPAAAVSGVNRLQERTSGSSPAFRRVIRAPAGACGQRRSQVMVFSSLAVHVRGSSAPSRVASRVEGPHRDDTRWPRCGRRLQQSLRPHKTPSRHAGPSPDPEAVAVSAVPPGSPGLVWRRPPGAPPRVPDRIAEPSRTANGYSASDTPGAPSRPPV